MTAYTNQIRRLVDEIEQFRLGKLTRIEMISYLHTTANIVCSLEERAFSAFLNNRCAFLEFDFDGDRESFAASTLKKIETF